MPEEQDITPQHKVSEKTISEEVNKLKQALEEEKRKAETYLANWQRAQADFINFKRWTAQEREETAKLANASLMLRLLPVLDDLERAFAMVPPELADFSWIQGMKQIEHKFKSALELHGLTPIEALGQPFDPAFHEAVRQDKGPPGTIIGELEKGYLLNGKLLRPSKVIVGGEEFQEKEE